MFYLLLFKFYKVNERKWTLVNKIIVIIRKFDIKTSIITKEQIKWN